MLALNVQLEATQVKTSPQGFKGELSSGVQTESFSSMLESISKASAKDGKKEAVESQPVRSEKRSNESSVKKTSAKDSTQKQSSEKTETTDLAVFQENALVQEKLPPAKTISTTDTSFEDFIPEITLDSESSESIALMQESALANEEIPDIELPDFDSLKKEDLLDAKQVPLSDDVVELAENVAEQELLPLANANTNTKSKGQNLASKKASVRLENQVPAASEKETLTFKPSFEPKERSWSDSEWTKPLEEAPVFTVTDLRSTQEKVSFAKQVNHEVLNANMEHTNEHSATMTLTLSTNAQQNILSSNAQSAASSSSNFQQMLASQIQQNAPDFVKATNFVLRDSNQGTIDMILKPEQLGNVKVSLQVSDKVIAGQITVASKEALEAFKQNLETLKQALIQNGFENASLTLSMSDGTAANNSSFAQHEQADRQYRSERVYGQYASDTDSQTDLPVDSNAFRADGTRYAIDVVA